MYIDLRYLCLAELNCMQREVQGLPILLASPSPPFPETNLVLIQCMTK